MGSDGQENMKRSALIVRTRLRPPPPLTIVMMKVMMMMMMMMMLMNGTDAKVEIITSKYDVMVGEEVLLLCKAGGEGEITWMKHDEEIDDDEKVFKIDETSSKLFIKKVSMQDAGKYTCVLEFDNGHNDRVSMQLYVYEGPSFGRTTNYHEFLEGGAGLVPCVATGQPAVDVHWIRDKQAIPASEGHRVRQLTDNTLRFDSVRREDAGTYLCQAQIRGRTVYQTLSVSVVVNAPPSVRLKEEEKKVLAGPDTHVSLLCLVDGLPKPNINWTMPMEFDPSKHHFNSDRSQLTIRSVVRANYGMYVCTATNKIAESSAAIMLDVLEAPEVFLSAEEERASLGERVSVSCNVSGHPHPQLHWVNKNSGITLDSVSGRVRVEDGELVMEKVTPSDGGLYSCMAVSSSGNASRDVAIYTQPDMPHYLTVSPGPASVLFSLKTPPISGGTPITGYVLQWRQSPAEDWHEVNVPAGDPLVTSDLMPYSLYLVRLGAMNAVGVGLFSDTFTVRTQATREPDRPELSVHQMKVERNSFSVPLKQTDEGGSPVQHVQARYRQDQEEAKWTEKQLSAGADSVSIQDLSFGSGYLLEVTAVNANGSSVPASFNFTIGEEPVSRMTKGSVVAIVIVLFLLVFLLVDACCCYRNRCGLLMAIAVKIFGQKVPCLKMLGDVEGSANGLKLKGISTPRGSIQMAGVQNQDGGQIREVTCDKVSLTRHEKVLAGRELPGANP